MTFREKLKWEHPEMVNERYYIGGCKDCPKCYGYEDNSPNCIITSCKECWDREIPESEVLSCSETPNSSDTISRQAAIDALGEKPLAWNSGEYELGMINQWESDVDAIKSLPSAQPEIITCGECAHRYVEGNHVRFNRCELNHNNVQSDDWYCGDAERRADD